MGRGDTESFLERLIPKICGSFKDAAVVDLAGTGASDADLEPLRHSELLVALNLTGCQTTDDGLAKLKGIVNLKYLFLGDTKVTERGIEADQRAQRARDNRAG